LTFDWNLISLKLMLIKYWLLFLLIRQFGLKLDLNFLGWLSIGTDLLFLIEVLIQILQFFMFYFDLLLN